MENENKSPDHLSTAHSGDNINSDAPPGDNNNIDKYNTYRQYEKEYTEKVNSFIAAYAQAQNDPEELNNWPATGQKYTAEIYDAMQRWEELGFKKEMDDLMDVVDLELDLEHKEQKLEPTEEK
jgi:hypothetical protein